MSVSMVLRQLGSGMIVSVEIFFLTLIFSMDGFYSIATENVVIHRILLAILVMAIIDWLKMKFRLTPNSDRMGASIQTLQSQSPCNYHMVGTASYLSNMGHR